MRRPQGRRGAPTLGFGTESPWHSPLDARLCGSNYSDTLEENQTEEDPILSHRFCARSI